jgi:hypothetical protein
MEKMKMDTVEKTVTVLGLTGCIVSTGTMMIFSSNITVIIAMVPVAIISGGALGCGVFAWLSYRRFNRCH